MRERRGPFSKQRSAPIEHIRARKTPSLIRNTNPLSFRHYRRSPIPHARTEDEWSLASQPRIAIPDVKLTGQRREGRQ